MVGFAILFIALSLINIFFPSLGWYTRYGWMVKGDSEPSKAYLVISRVSSIIMLLLFFIFFFSDAVDLNGLEKAIAPASFIAKIHLLSYCLFKGVIVVRIAFWIVFAFVGILIFGIVGGLIGRKKRK